MRNTIVAGNWKMNKSYSETVGFIQKLTEFLDSCNLTGVIPVICPPYVYLRDCINLSRKSKLIIAAQDVSSRVSGAYTGEVCAGMLSSIEVPYSLIGHSERREYHQETDEVIREKLIRLMDNGLIPVVCIGEKEEEREQGITSEVILKQLTTIFRDIELSDPYKIIIAYEPVWAIGTGKTATPEMAQEVHLLIRKWLIDNYATPFADNVSILYGGSIKPDNFEHLLDQPDIDGGLIGGASLRFDDYRDLLQIALKRKIPDKNSDT